MNKAEQVIKRYEAARQRKNMLEDVRRRLIANCANLYKFDPVTREIETGDNCFALAFAHTMKLNKAASFDDCYSFDEVFANGELENGMSVCLSCKEAHEIKRGPLAEAKKELGSAKRQLAAIGKQLIAREGKL